MGLAVILGVISGFAAWEYWKYTRQPQNSIWQELRTDAQGRKIMEVIGVKGEDDQKSVTGYLLPDKVEQNKFPLTVIVVPNAIIADKKMGEKITFDFARGEDVVYHGAQEEQVFYESLKKRAVGIPAKK